MTTIACYPRESSSSNYILITSTIDSSSAIEIVQLDGNISVYSEFSDPDHSRSSLSETEVGLLQGQMFSNIEDISPDKTNLPGEPQKSGVNKPNFFLNPIEVIVGNRTTLKHEKEPRQTCRKTIRRDNRGQLSLFLPNMAVYNHRSI